MAFGALRARNGMTLARSTPGARRVSGQIRDARARGASLRVVGRGSWLEGGRPCTAAEHLDLSDIEGIVAHEPGDFTLTARAGTSLAAVQDAAAAAGQWLGLDPYGSARGSIGATLATASFGPLISSFGPPRDHVLGCEFVTGTGDIVHAGGRVVKNVAGFDLVRLAVGAWGTVGALTEVTVRLRARPAVDQTVALIVDANSHAIAVERAWRFLRQSEFAPLAAELLSPALASRMELPPGATLLMRIGGNASFVRAARASTEELGRVHEVDGSIWDSLSASESPTHCVLRLSTLPSRLNQIWPRALALAEANAGFASATLTRGIVRCVFPTPERAELAGVASAIETLGDGLTWVGERLPGILWQAIARDSSAGSLARKVCRAFDPDGIMNPGILGTA